MRLAFGLLVLLLVPGCGSTPDPAPETIVGAWAGEGRQWDDGDRSGEPDGTWPVRIVVVEGADGDPFGTISYPSFPCSGRLDYIGPSTERDARPGDAVFREVITEGADICFDGGTVLLRADRGFLMYAWATSAAPAVAAARLSRDDEE